MATRSGTHRSTPTSSRASWRRGPPWRCSRAVHDDRLDAAGGGRTDAYSCKGPPVLIALAVSGCMSSPAGSVGGVEFGSEGRARDGCEASYAVSYTHLRAHE